jgi:uncharacterized membrane protein (UPF0127 family)
MKIVRLVNATQDRVLCERCGLANNIWTRVRGLLGRKTLPDDEGLFITPCPSIHMWGMKFAIDVVFVTRENIVTDIIENIAPGRYYVAKAQRGKPFAAIELPAGKVAANKVVIGDQIVVEEAPLSSAAR